MSGARRDQRARPPGRESRRFRMGPAVSIVVVSTGDRARLEACLERLRPQCREHAAEVIVVRAAPASEIGELAEAYSWVRIVAGEDDESEADLRVEGMAVTTGDVVGIRTDDGEVREDYVLRLTGAPRAARRGGAESIRQED